jgi:hypothetical protein
MQQMVPQLTKAQMKLPQTKRELRQLFRQLTAPGATAWLMHSADDDVGPNSKLIVYQFLAASMCFKYDALALQLCECMCVEEWMKSDRKHSGSITATSSAVLRSTAWCRHTLQLHVLPLVCCMLFNTA